ncbi:hypothetical protein [uncultured Lutibacter sp.]|uniref:hypothetical protein n=1 Tax=uncultured Lutibacter sp. TaxID=437739 RepID=UPI002615ADB2|nr:hypothetical protein [uncultured Lutibacter sp.]
MKKILLVILAMAFIKIGYSQDYKFGKVSKKELEEQFYPLDSLANAAYLYKKRRRYVRLEARQLKLITNVHVRLKVYKKEGFNWSTININLLGQGAHTSENAYKFKAATYNLVNGVVEKTKLDKKDIFLEQKSDFLKVKKFTMPNVKEGSVLEWTYEIQSPYISNMDDILVQHKIPVKKLEEKVELLGWFNFNKRQKGYYPFKIHQSTKTNPSFQIANQVIEVLEENIPALKSEPYVNNMSNYAAALQFEVASIQAPDINMFQNFATSWEEIAKNALKSPSFGEQLNNTEHLEDDLKKLKLELTTTSAKIIAALEYVKSKIKWNGNFGQYCEKGIKKAFTEGAGNVADINLTLVAVLRELGLTAYPVLTSTRSNGIPLVPTVKGFNYVVVVVNTIEGKVLLDASEKYSLPNVLPLRALNWKGTIVSNNTNVDFVDLTSPIISNVEYNINYKIDEKGFIEGMNRKKYENLKAINYRNEKSNLDENELISTIEQDYNDIKILDFRLLNLDKISLPIIEMYKFEKEEGVEFIGDKMYFTPMLFAAINENPFKLEEREYPIDFGTPWQKKITSIIEIPKDYKIESLPEDIAVGMREELGEFIYSIKTDGNKIILQALIKINKGLVTANFYQEIKSFYKMIVDKSTEKIILTNKQHIR